MTVLLSHQPWENDQEKRRIALLGPCSAATPPAARFTGPHRGGIPAVVGGTDSLMGPNWSPQAPGSEGPTDY